MIVKRGWTTSRTAKSWESGQYVIERWIGWFLFGIIPIYIKQTNAYSQSLISYGN